MRRYTIAAAFLLSAGIGFAAVIHGAPLGPAIPLATGALECPDCNVVLISVEPLRKNHLTPYNYTRNTTPTLQTLSKTSTVYTNAYTTSSHTTTALTSTLTSLYPMQHNTSPGNVRARWQSNDFHSLAETLNAAGYQTYAHTDGANVAGSLGFDRGFDSYNLRGVDEFRSRIRNNKDQPFFLFWQSFAPHHPYRFADRYKQLWANESNSARHAYTQLTDNYPETVDSLEENGIPWYQAFHEAYFKYLEQNESVKQEALRAYDTRIRQTDNRINSIIQTLKQTGHYNNTIIIFTAQHGEAFGEHRVDSERFGDRRSWYHFSLYEEIINVPLVVHLPQTVQTRASDQYTSIIDLAPTILALLRIHNMTYQHQAQGKSLLPTLIGNPINKQHIAGISFGSVTYIDPRTELKYVRGRKPVWNPRPEPERVYNLSANPDEHLTTAETIKWMRTQFHAFREKLGSEPAPTTPIYPYNAQ